MNPKRRSFVKSTGTYGLALLLAPHLISCKSKSTEVIEEISKKAAEGSYYNLKTSEAASYKLTKLTNSIWTFEERGGTIGLYLDKNGICVIDTQFPEQSRNVLDLIKSHSDRSIDYLVNTHHHGDHTAGNITFKELVGKHIAHANSLINQTKSAEKKANLDLQLFPSTTFDKSWSGTLGEEIVKMQYFGLGHTNGDAVTTFVNSNVVHMGDLVFNRRFPYIDKGAGANIENWISVLDKTLAAHNPETKYIFGHADNGHTINGNSEDIKAFQNYLEKLLEFGLKARKDGLSLEEAKKTTKGIPGADEWKGDGIARSLDALYAELAI